MNSRLPDTPPSPTVGFTAYPKFQIYVSEQYHEGFWPASYREPTWFAATEY